MKSIDWIVCHPFRLLDPQAPGQWVLHRAKFLAASGERQIQNIETILKKSKYALKNINIHVSLWGTMFVCETLQTPSRYPKCTPRVPSEYLARTQRVPSEYSASNQRVLSEYLASTQWVPSEYSVSTLRVPSEYPASTKRVPREYPAST